MNVHARAMVCGEQAQSTADACMYVRACSRYINMLHVIAV
jgi:hypothetical protein